MSKNYKMIAISLVTIMAIYGTYKYSNAKDVTDINIEVLESDIQEESKISTEQNDSFVKKVMDKVINKKSVKKININDISLEPDEFDDETCDNPVYIPDADEICVKKNEYNYTLISDGTSEGRKNALKQKAIEIRDEDFGGETPIDNPSVGAKVCKVVLAEQIYRNSGQWDLYHVFFCNNREQIAGKLEIRSGGIDSDGIEYIESTGYLPYAPSMTASITPNITLEEMKKSSQFNAKKELPRNIEDSKKIVSDYIGNNNIVSERLVTRFDDIDGYSSFHEFNVEDIDGNINKYYVGAFGGNVVLSRKDMDLLEKHSKAAQKIVDQTPSKEWHKYDLIIPEKLDAYLAERIDYSNKEIEYYDNLKHVLK